MPRKSDKKPKRSIGEINNFMVYRKTQVQELNCLFHIQVVRQQLKNQRNFSNISRVTELIRYKIPGINDGFLSLLPENEIRVLSVICTMK